MYAVFLILAFIGAASAQILGFGGSWLGAYDSNSTTSASIVQAAQNPNISRSANVNIAQGSFTVRVNLTDALTAPGGRERRSVRSYDLSWNGSTTLIQQLGSDKLCVTFGYWTFPPMTSNAHEASGSGSCVFAFGKTCDDALRRIQYNVSESYEQGCRTLALPAACMDKFPLGRNEARRADDAFSMTSSNRIRNGGVSPLPLLYNTSAISYAEEDARPFEFERDRLHFLLLSATHGESTPICIRLSVNKITAAGAYQDWTKTQSGSGSARPTGAGSSLDARPSAFLAVMVSMVSL